MFEEGNCFWIETNLDQERKIQGHFFILILKCSGDRIVIVNIDKTRGRKKYDITTILQAKEGTDFITEQSFVNYDDAELTDVSNLESKIENGIAKHRGVMNDATVKKICDGVLDSDFTPEEVREVFMDRLYNQIS